MHDVARHGGVQLNPAYVPSPPVVAPEEEEAKAAYQAALEEALQRAL